MSVCDRFPSGSAVDKSQRPQVRTFSRGAKLARIGHMLLPGSPHAAQVSGFHVLGAIEASLVWTCRLWAS